MKYDKHITVLSILYIGSGALLILAACLAALFLIGGGIAGHGVPLAAFLLMLAIGFLAVLPILSIVGGWGLRQRKPWARNLVLVLGFLSLLNVPLGTALGMYTIWLLMQEEADTYFGSNQSTLGNTTPSLGELPSQEDAATA